MSNSKKSELERLKDTWYDKLRESGFDDIEQDEYRLKNWTSTLANRLSPEQREAKESYYRMARIFLNDNKFENKIEKVIWEYHSEGVSIRNIVSLLAEAKLIKTSRDAVWLTVKRLRDNMRKTYELPSDDEYFD